MRKRSIKNRKLTCSKCNKLKESNRLQYGYCKSCHNENMRHKRPKHSELTPEQRLKANCRSYLNQYIIRGKIIKPQYCSIPGCLNTNLQAHHDNYSKPLDVKWLCLQHHIEYHQTHERNS